jgi:hypothetical protein
MANERHPNAWIGDMRSVVDTKLMQDIVNDNRSRPSSGGSMLPTVKVVGAGTVKTGDVGPSHRPYQEPAQEADRSGWRDAAPLGQPPGIRHIDAMLDAEDRQWRAERIKELAGASVAQRALAQAAAEAERKDREAEAKEKPGNKGERK